MAEKKYYWLKLPKDFFTKHYVLRILSKDNGMELLLFYIRLLTESIDHEGKLRYSDKTPYTEESLSEITCFPLQTVTLALQLFTELELIVIESDGTIFLPKCLKMIGSETASAERVRRFRNNQKEKAEIQKNSLCNDDVTERNKSIQKSNVEKEIEKEIDNNNSCAEKPHDNKKEEELKHDFEIIYAIYPKKAGKTVAFANYKLWVSKNGKNVGGKNYRLTNKQIYKAVKKYVTQQEQAGKELEYWKNFDTLMGRQLLDYVEWEEK